jgi:hypothetical protein
MNRWVSNEMQSIKLIFQELKAGGTSPKPQPIFKNVIGLPLAPMLKT